LTHRLPRARSRGARSSRGIFFYPRHGFGQISEKLWEAAAAAGARTLLGTTVRRITAGLRGMEVEVEKGGATRVLKADHLWSTIPVGPLVGLLDPPPPSEVLRSARSLQQRALLLVYLVLGQDRFTEFDAHYVPDPAIPFTRLSEPKNYGARKEPADRTVLCAEIPCSPEDAAWRHEPGELGEMVQEGMRRAGLPVPGPLLEVVLRRLPSAYPIYRRGFETHLQRLEDWLEGIPGLLTFGRQGLFAHDNTHHALFMARAAVSCLNEDGHFKKERWAGFRRVFATHVVED
ncbi:FAD-dependent oxidoreductase, partial [Gemmatimonadota bacterium]